MKEIEVPAGWLNTPFGEHMLRASPRIGALRQKLCPTAEFTETVLTLGENGWHHLIAATTAEKSGQAKTLCEIFLRELADGMTCCIRVRPAEEELTDFSTGKRHRRGFVRFSMKIEPGTWAHTENVTNGSYIGLATVAPLVVKPGGEIDPAQLKDTLTEWYGTDVTLPGEDKSVIDKRKLSGEISRQFIVDDPLTLVPPIKTEPEPYLITDNPDFWLGELQRITSGPMDDNRRDAFLTTENAIIRVAEQGILWKITDLAINLIGDSNRAAAKYLIRAMVEKHGQGVVVLAYNLGCDLFELRRIRNSRPDRNAGHDKTRCVCDECCLWRSQQVKLGRDDGNFFRRPVRYDAPFAHDYSKCFKASPRDYVIDAATVAMIGRGDHAAGVKWMNAVIELFKKYSPGSKGNPAQQERLLASQPATVASAQAGRGESDKARPAGFVCRRPAGFLHPRGLCPTCDEAHLATQRMLDWPIG